MSVCFCHPVLNPHKVDRMAYFEVLAHSLSLYAKIASLKHDIGFIDLNYVAATRETVANALRKHQDIDTFIFAGHANATGERLTGQGLEACLDVCTAGSLKGRKTYLISCNTGSGLAVRAVDSGALFCIAFGGRVYLMSRRQEAIVSSCLIDSLLIARVEEPEAIFRSILQRHREWIERILRIRQPHTTNGWLLALSVLDWNMEHLVLVTKDGVEEGESILPKISNSSESVSERDLQRAIDYVRHLMADEVKSPIPDVVTGDDEDLSSAAILSKLEERQRSGNWGRDDFAERYLLSVLKKLHIVS